MKTYFLYGIIISLIIIIIVTITCIEKFKNTKSDNKLIWFHHVHKAGGTSFIKLAELNNEKLYYKDSRNGLPTNRYGYFIPFGSMDINEQEQFIKDAKNNGTTFIATEFNYPMPKNKYDDDSIINIIMIRNPINKLISHLAHLLREPEEYRYDYNDKNPESIIKKNTKHFGNVMTKVLAGYDFNEKINITHNDYNTALTNLKNFDIILVLEDSQSLLKMQSLGWKNFNLPRDNISSTRDFQTNVGYNTVDKVREILKEWLGDDYENILKKEYVNFDQKLYDYCNYINNKNYM